MDGGGGRPRVDRFPADRAAARARWTATRRRQSGIAQPTAADRPGGARSGAPRGVRRGGGEPGRRPHRRRGPAAARLGGEPAVRGADGTATYRADDSDDGARVRPAVRVGAARAGGDCGQPRRGDHRRRAAPQADHRHERPRGDHHRGRPGAVRHAGARRRHLRAGPGPAGQDQPGRRHRRDGPLREHRRHADRVQPADAGRLAPVAAAALHPSGRHPPRFAQPPAAAEPGQPDLGGRALRAHALAVGDRTGGHPQLRRGTGNAGGTGRTPRDAARHPGDGAHARLAVRLDA